MAYYKKFSEHPDRYKIVRTAGDIDTAIAERKLGIVFSHRGTALFGRDVEMVGLWRQLGYGYCLVAYNQRNSTGDGCFDQENGPLTDHDKQVVDAYNRYGMIVDLSHTGERISLDAIERSSMPCISSHSGARAITDYPRNLSDACHLTARAKEPTCSHRKELGPGEPADPVEGPCRQRFDPVTDSLKSSVTMFN